MPLSTMSTDPDEIGLFPEHRKCIAELADSLGHAWPDVLTAIIRAAKFGFSFDEYGLLRAQEKSLRKIWDSDYDSIFDEM